MARFRIKQCPSLLNPGEPIFVIQERWLFFWLEVGLKLSLEDADCLVRVLQKSKPVETKVIKEYD